MLAEWEQSQDEKIEAPGLCKMVKMKLRGFSYFKNNFGMYESLVNPPALGVGDREFTSHHSDDDKCKKQ